MNEPLHEPSQGTRYSLYYITGGSLLMIWSAVWFYYLRQNALAEDGRYYVCAGMMLSGLALLIIGLLVGRIGREAKHADIPVGTVAAAAIAPTNPEAANGVQPGATAVPMAPVPAAPVGQPVAGPR